MNNLEPEEKSEKKKKQHLKTGEKSGMDGVSFKKNANTW